MRRFTREDLVEVYGEELINREPKREHDIVRALSNDEFKEYDFNNQTKHYSNERITRHDKYDNMGLLDSEIIAGFEVDKGHKNGSEIHLINADAIIFIYNTNSRKLINLIGARSGQIFRYWFNFYDIKKVRDLPQNIRDLYILADERMLNNPIHEL